MAMWLVSLLAELAQFFGISVRDFFNWLRNRRKSQAVEQLLPPVKIAPSPRRYLEMLFAKTAGLLKQRGIIKPSDYLVRHLRSVHDERRLERMQDLAEYLLACPAAVILGEAGAGKSITCLILTRYLTKAAISSDKPGWLPILVTSDDIQQQTLHSDANARQSQVEQFEQYLGSRIAEAILSGAPHKDWDVKLAQLSNAPNVVLLLEGFDELSAVERQGASVRTNLVQAIQNFHRRRLSFVVSIVVTCRPEAIAALLPLRPVELSLLLISEGQIQAYVRSEWPQLDAAAESISRVFVDKLAARPLYLRPLCQFVKQYGPSSLAGKITGTGLLISEIDRQLQENQKELGWDNSLLVQRSCLALAAHEILQIGMLSLTQLTSVIRTVVSGSNREQQMRELEHVLGRFFLRVDDQFRFHHDDFRDYWLSWGILQQLQNKGTLLKIPLQALLEVRRVMEITADLINDLKSDLEKVIHQELLNAIQRDKGPANLTTRNSYSAGAAALSLHLRCFPHKSLVDSLVNFQGCCLQGLDAEKMDLRALNFSGASLRDSNLCGADLSLTNLTRADLDNAVLRGANLSFANLSNAALRNAEFGSLEPKNNHAGGPTRFTNAELTGADWFNYRASLRGYTQFWDAILVDEKQLCVAVSGPAEHDLWFYDVSQLESANPQTAWSGHRVDRDVISLDHWAKNSLWLTCSRDQSVRLSTGNPFSSADLRLSETFKLECFNNSYPRRAAFSLNGKWVAMTDRQGMVYLIACDVNKNILVGEPAVFSEHSGPVMCLERALLGSRNLFFTAGYDGTVIQWTEPHENTADPNLWEARTVADLHHDYGSSHNHIIRALTLSSQAHSGNTGIGLWIGDESHALFFLRLSSTLDAAAKLQRLSESFTAGIFSLATDHDGKRLAVGLADGWVHLFEVRHSGTTAPVALNELTKFQLPCGDIVRKLLFIEADQKLVAVSWAGTIAVGNILEKTCTMIAQPNSQHWKAELDRDKLIFGGSASPEKLQGISDSFKKYLSRLV